MQKFDTAAGMKQITERGQGLASLVPSFSLPRSNALRTIPSRGSFKLGRQMDRARANRATQADTEVRNHHCPCRKV